MTNWERRKTKRERIRPDYCNDGQREKHFVFYPQNQSFKTEKKNLKQTCGKNKGIIRGRKEKKKIFLFLFLKVKIV